AATAATETPAAANAGASPAVQAAAVAPSAPAKASPARPVARVEHAVLKDGETRTSHAETPVINLRWLTRGEVNVGQECRCGLEVKNNSVVPASDVLVEAYFPRSVRLLSAEPYPTDSRDHLSWRFET